MRTLPSVAGFKTMERRHNTVARARDVALARCEQEVGARRSAENLAEELISCVRRQLNVLGYPRGQPIFVLLDNTASVSEKEGGCVILLQRILRGKDNTARARERGNVLVAAVLDAAEWEEGSVVVWRGVDMWMACLFPFYPGAVLNLVR